MVERTEKSMMAGTIMTTNCSVTFMHVCVEVQNFTTHKHQNDKVIAKCWPSFLGLWGPTKNLPLPSYLRYCMLIRVLQIWPFFEFQAGFRECLKNSIFYYKPENRGSGGGVKQPLNDPKFFLTTFDNICTQNKKTQLETQKIWSTLMLIYGYQQTNQQTHKLRKA